MSGDLQPDGAELLVGRERELERALEVLEPAPEPRILLLHGDGGIGKSAVARAVAARAGERGFRTHLLDARELSLDPDALPEALAPALADARPFVLLDSFELIEAAEDYVRDEVLPELPSGSALLVVGRNPPSPSWPRDAIDLHLGPLGDEAARDLLEVSGLEGPPAERLLSWARGYPLALSLGARIAADAPALLDADGPAGDLVQALARSLGDSGVGSAHFATLAVAAIARSTTPGLLAAALPGHDPGAEWSWLASRSFIEPVGEGIALHALLRDAVRADLKRRDAQLERDLKRRIGDYLYESADERGELSKAVELSFLIEDPALRWGFLWDASRSYYVASPRPGDVDRIDRQLAEPAAHPIWSGQAMWEINRRFFERMPEFGAVVRGADGVIAGFTFVPTTAVDDAELEAAPVIGPLLAYARSLEPRGEALLMTDMSDLTGDPANGMVGILANAALLRASRSNPRYVLMTIDEEIELGQLFAANVGARRVPELDAAPGPERLLCWLLDFGAGGFLANQRELLYRELNLAPPPRPPESASAIGTEQVREALRDFNSPVKLAGSPLAVGDDVAERSESVRRLLTDAVADAFGDDPEERLLREALEQGYLKPGPTHELVAERLHLSRSAYFRRLRQAVRRVSDYLRRR